MAKLRQALSLSSSTYKNHVFEGFAQLQQNDEFVDMTLAADGHWVKVHRTLVALSSPYFRELLKSMPSQHPVIYLSGISNEALGYLLEFVYTGEANIPAEKLKSFLNTARDLQIAGLMNVIPPEEKEMPTPNKDAENTLLNSRIQYEDNYSLHLAAPAVDEQQSSVDEENNDNSHSVINVVHSEENKKSEFQNVESLNMLNITIDGSADNGSNDQIPVAKIEILSNIPINRNSSTATDQCQLSRSYNEAFIKFNNQKVSVNDETNIPIDKSASTNQLSNDGDNIPMSEDICEGGFQNTDNIATMLTPVIDLRTDDQRPEKVQQDSVLYTISNRGALQLILNRFMYYCQYYRERKHKRRWRCIDYRDAHCPAAIDTVGDQIVNRKHMHCHPNHDEKIRKKLTRSNVKCFPSIELSQAVSRTTRKSSDNEDAP